MKLYAHKQDIDAQNFIQHQLQASPTSLPGDEYIEYFKPGGGRRPVIVSSADQQSVGKAGYSIKQKSDWPAQLTFNRPQPTTYVHLHVCPSHPKLLKRLTDIQGALTTESQLWIATKKQRGRGGAICYGELDYTGRIVSQPADFPANLPPNDFFTAASGFNQPVATYGTSDAANVFELLAALKAGALFDLPVVFDQYQSAHIVENFARRVLTPSLAMLNTTLNVADLGLNPKGKLTQIMNPDRVQTAFAAAGLSIANQAEQAAINQTVAGWYRQAMSLLADQWLALIGATVPYQIIPLETLFQQLPAWHSAVPAYANIIEGKAKHQVGLLNYDWGDERLDTDSLITDWGGGTAVRVGGETLIKSRNQFSMPQTTIAQAHQQGYWLAGYPIYHLGYSLGLGGGVLQLVKDGSKGDVHRLAKPFLENPQSGLHLLPVGLFRLHATGQNPDASIDPWVMLELLQRWEPSQAKRLARQIWALLDVPLAADRVGREIRVSVDLNGLEVQIT